MQRCATALRWARVRRVQALRNVRQWRPVSQTVGRVNKCPAEEFATRANMDASMREDIQVNKSLDVPENKGSVKDSQLIWDQVKTNLVAKYGEEGLQFPKDIIWVAGAPGAGKGRMTKLIMKERGFHGKCQIEVSSLLQSPECIEMKQSGLLVDDRVVVELVMEKLLDKRFQQGVIVDGFPRTKTQGEMIKHLYEYMFELRSFYGRRFRRPKFRIAVLFVDENTSIERQLARGRKVKEHNQRVRETGIGQVMPLRDTDIDPNKARERYRQFMKHVYTALQAVQHGFAFHFINANGSVEEVQALIKQELSYQSSLELGEATFESIRRLPLASEIIRNARHMLVKRLDSYQIGQPKKFEAVLRLLQERFMPIIARQALSGKAIVRSEDELFSEPDVIDMALDVLTERGFRVVLDLKKRKLLSHIDENSDVSFKEQRVYEFQIEFPRPKIRAFATSEVD